MKQLLLFFVKKSSIGLKCAASEEKKIKWNKIKLNIFSINMMVRSFWELYKCFVFALISFLNKSIYLHQRLNHVCVWKTKTKKKNNLDKLKSLSHSPAHIIGAVVRVHGGGFTPWMFQSFIPFRNEIMLNIIWNFWQEWKKNPL